MSFAQKVLKNSSTAFLWIGEICISGHPKCAIEEEYTAHPQHFSLYPIYHLKPSETDFHRNPYGCTLEAFLEITGIMVYRTLRQCWIHRPLLSVHDVTWRCFLTRFRILIAVVWRATNNLILSSYPTTVSATDIEMSLPTFHINNQVHPQGPTDATSERELKNRNLRSLSRQWMSLGS